jgi:hypothetical protein
VVAGEEPAALPCTPAAGEPAAAPVTDERRGAHDWASEPTERAPLGLLLGARSGDKGGNANIGVWARTDRAYDWMLSYLTCERLRELMPETSRLAIDRYALPNARAVNFVVHGILGEGVAATARPDAQAKSLGEFLRSRTADVPRALLAGVRWGTP